MFPGRQGTTRVGRVLVAPRRVAPRGLGSDGKRAARKDTLVRSAEERTSITGAMAQRRGADAKASALPLPLEAVNIQMGVLPREHLGQGLPPRGVRAAPRALGTAAVRAGRYQEGQAAKERGTLPPSWHACGRRWGPRAAIGWCVYTSRRSSVGLGWHAGSPTCNVFALKGPWGPSPSRASQQTL